VAIYVPHNVVAGVPLLNTRSIFLLLLLLLVVVVVVVEDMLIQATIGHVLIDK